MTTLDKAIMKVYEKGVAAKKRRSVGSEPGTTRELYVDPARVEPPEPAIDAATSMPETSDAEPNQTAEPPSTGVPLTTAPVPLDTAEPRQAEPMASRDTEPLLSAGDLTSSLESFVVQQHFEIPVLEDEIAVFLEPPSEEREQAYAVEAETPIEQDTRVAWGNPEPLELPSDQLAATPAPFVPAWEVDSFRLSDPCRQIAERLGEPLSAAATHLRNQTAENKKVISVHSRARHEGKTTVAVSLALAMTRTGANVLVIDADHANPALARSLDLAVEQGWEAAIYGDVPISECCIRSVNAFTVMPLTDAAIQADPAELLDALRLIVAELQASFDLILIDTADDSAEWGTTLQDLTAARIAVRDVRRTDNQSLAQLVSSLTSLSNTVDTVDNFA